MLVGSRVRLTRSLRTFGLVEWDEGIVMDTDAIDGVLVNFSGSEYPHERAIWLRPSEYEVISRPVEREETPKVKSDGGGGQNYYDLPEGAKQLQDLIEYRNMNGNVKDIFKACYRLGEKEGTEELYDIRKMVYYSLRELGRRLKRKDYLNLAEEVIGHQHEEPTQN